MATSQGSGYLFLSRRTPAKSVFFREMENIARGAGLVVLRTPAGEEGFRGARTETVTQGFVTTQMGSVSVTVPVNKTTLTLQTGFRVGRVACVATWYGPDDLGQATQHIEAVNFVMWQKATARP
jgi:hypothetical protein